MPMLHADIPDGEDRQDDWQDDWEKAYPSEELGALNDCDVREWLWCSNCLSCIEAGAKAFRQAEKADEWRDRDDREEAWAEVLRQRKVDAVAAEHAARQTSMFSGAGDS